MLHPNQFQINEAWIVFKLNDEPIHTELDLKQASLKRAREAAQYSNSVQVPGISFYIGK
jgi:hypothetical protein